MPCLESWPDFTDEMVKCPASVVEEQQGDLGKENSVKETDEI